MDIATAWLLHALTKSRRGGEGRARIYISIFWLFNPLVAIISARGNADSLVCAAVLLSLYLLTRGYWLPSAIVHGLLATHLKLFPVIYLPSSFVHLAMR